MAVEGESGPDPFRKNLEHQIDGNLQQIGAETPKSSKIACTETPFETTAQRSRKLWLLTAWGRAAGIGAHWYIQIQLVYAS